MTGDQWFDFWMRWMQIGGSGLLTFIGGWLGYRIARRGDSRDRWMEQVLSWNKRALAVTDKLIAGRKAGTPADTLSRTLLAEHATAIGEDPPTGGSRIVPSPAQFIVVEVGLALVRYPDAPEETIVELQRLTTEYNRWSLMGHGPRWHSRVSRLGHIQRSKPEAAIARRGYGPPTD